MTNTIKIEAIHTDTFGGEPNFCWAHRVTVEIPENLSDLALVRRIKRELGLSGVPCRRTYGDISRLDIVGCCQCILIDDEPV